MLCLEDGQPKRSMAQHIITPRSNNNPLPSENYEELDGANVAKPSTSGEMCEESPVAAATTIQQPPPTETTAVNHGQ